MNKSRLTKVFEGKKALMAFVTGGDPNIETTEKLIAVMAEAGVDVVQIGVPFSDPVAGGTEAQQSDARSLANGYTVENIFDMTAKVREKVKIPLLLKSYMNPIFVYGKGRFIEKCNQSGIDGIIVPDLPFEEKDELAENCSKHGVALIPFIAPAAMDRIEIVAKDATDFVIAPLFDTAFIKMVKAVSSVPCVVAFDAPTPKQVQEAMAETDGLAIENAVVRLIAQYGEDCIGYVKDYIEEIRSVI